MNYNDHDPPHFHARAEGQEVIVGIDTGIVYGSMSKARLRMVLSWAEEHQVELLENWKRARARMNLMAIPPLE